MRSFTVMLQLLLALMLAPPPIGWQIEQGPTPGAVVDSSPFEALALSWFAPDAVSVSVRVSEDGLTWSGWLPLAIDGDSSSDQRSVSAITHFGAAKRYVEYAFSGPVHGVTLTMFPPPDATRARRTTGNLTFGPIPVRSRLEWGCPDGQSARWTPAYTTVTHAVVHHTAGSNSVADWDQEIRNIWFLHTITNGWGDIGYNFLIAPDGTIYEGRAGGDRAIGAHFSCRNSNTAGIALLGTFSNVPPTDAALASSRILLTEVVRRNGIDPAASRLHPSSGLQLPTILGHRDGNVPGATCTITECPGHALYSMLPAIRTDLACGPYIDFHPSPALIVASETATLTVKPRGAEPFTYQWYAGTAAIDGATSATLTVSPSTTTTYRVRVSNSCGSVDSAEATVTVTSARRRRAVRP